RLENRGLGLLASQRIHHHRRHLGEGRKTFYYQSGDPWDKWTIVLHPAQQELIEKNYEGPARVAGSAGTGKTIVALHRAVYLARKNPDARVLLATFSETLANALRTLLRRLISSEPRLGERIDVHSIPS